jgi:hypothetical protein
VGGSSSARSACDLLTTESAILYGYILSPLNQLKPGDQIYDIDTNQPIQGIGDRYKAIADSSSVTTKYYIFYQTDGTTITDVQLCSMIGVTPSPTPTQTPTPTRTQTNTPTNTLTPTVTPTNTNTPTNTQTPTPTKTQGFVESTFRSQWTTIENNETIQLPLVSYGTYNCVVDWGDSTLDTITSFSDNSHTYTNPGTYTISITGTIKGWSFSGTSVSALKIVKVLEWGPLQINNGAIQTRGAFQGCNNCEFSAVTDSLSMTDVTECISWFFDCFSFSDRAQTIQNSGLINNIHLWDMSNVTNLTQMFFSSKWFNDPGIGDWDVSNVTSLSSIFSRTTSSTTLDRDPFPVFNQSLSGWNVSNVTNIQNMFRNCPNFNQDISTWDVCNVSNATSFLFIASNRIATGGTFNQNLSDWKMPLIPSRPPDFGGNQPSLSATTSNTNLPQFGTPCVETPLGMTGFFNPGSVKITYLITGFTASSVSTRVDFVNTLGRNVGGPIEIFGYVTIPPNQTSGQTRYDLADIDYNSLNGTSSFNSLAIVGDPSFVYTLSATSLFNQAPPVLPQVPEEYVDPDTPTLPFIFKIDTTRIGDSDFPISENEFTLSVFEVGLSYNINWGDGNSQTFTI